LVSTGHLATVVGNVRGVLGEDFLQNFDVLIDYRHKVVRLESEGSSMAETAIGGEHLPLELNGTYHGQPTHNRLVISGHIQELGDKPMSLLSRELRRNKGVLAERDCESSIRSVASER